MTLNFFNDTFLSYLHICFAKTILWAFFFETSPRRSHFLEKHLVQKFSGARKLISKWSCSSINIFDFFRVKATYKIFYPEDRAFIEKNVFLPRVLVFTSCISEKQNGIHRLWRFWSSIWKKCTYLEGIRKLFSFF